MRILCVLTFAALMMGATGLAQPAAAQMYPGEDVIVNPAAFPPPQPGQSEIHLIPPWAHRAHHHHQAAANANTAATTTEAPATSADTTTEAATPARVKPSHRKHVAETAPATPPDATSGPANPIPFTFGGDSPEPAPPAKVAKAEPPPAHTAPAGGTQPAGFTKRGAILFAHDSTDLAPSQLDPLKLLAGDLNTAIADGATRVELQAYGGTPGDKSSDARRISLRRAIAIRQVLIDNGVPADRIDVHAMGGTTDKGEPDRVDVFVRTG